MVRKYSPKAQLHRSENMDLPNVAEAETDSACKPAIGSEFVVNAASKKYVRVDCLVLPS